MVEDKLFVKTPPRSTQKRHASMARSSPFRTPSRTPSRNVRRSSQKKPRMSPSPTILRYPSTPHLTPPYSGSNGVDRFIPSRRSMLNVDLCRKKLLSDDSDNNNGNDTTNDPNDPSVGNGDEKAQTPAETPVEKEYKRRMLSSLCNIPLDLLDEDAQPRGILSFGGGAASETNENNPSSCGRSPWRTNRLRLEDPYSHDSMRVLQQFESIDDRFSSAIRSADVINRKIPSQPCRILDAPDLVDDYYLNLISWSADNVLAVALAHCVYLWNAGSGEIHHLTTVDGDDDYVTSVSWCTIPGQSKYLAIGTNSHKVQLWDTQATRLVRTLRGHSGRVASMAWNQHWLSSGGRDSMIIQHDVRSANNVVARYKAHEQEVCGLKWNGRWMNMVFVQCI